MRKGLKRLAGVLLLCGVPAMAADQAFETFGDGAQGRWDYIADTVMGGVSDGGARFEAVDGRQAVILSGEVSTENNGGFIQVRRKLADGLPAGTEGLRLTVRGNAETYYVFVRTEEMTRPWQFYRAPFTAGTDWETVDIPLTALQRSHDHLAEVPDPQAIISIGLAAYGKDYSADLTVAEIELY